MTKKKRIYGEGTITQRKDGRYQVSVPGADGKRRYKYAPNEREAERIRRQLLAEVEQGKVPASRQLFQQHVREWLEIKKKGKDYEPSSYLSIVYCFDAHFVPALGHLPLNKLAPSHIQKLYNKLLDQELSPNTLRVYHGRLKVCLDLAVKQGKIDSNPCSRVELPRRVKSKNSFLSQEESLQLLEAVQKHKLFSVLVPLALATEARESELLALTWSDVDLDQGVIRINKTLAKGQKDDTPVWYIGSPKSESGIRDIPLPDFAIQMLRSYKTSQRKQHLAAGTPNKHNLLFIARNGSYYRTDSVSRSFTRFASKLGFDITFHSLRHTGATLLLEAGVDPNAVKERLGHSDITITLGTYGHVTRKMRDQSVNTLNHLFTDSQKGKNEAI